MKPLISLSAALLLALSLCGCFDYSAEYTTRVTVNTDPQGASVYVDNDGEPGRQVAVTPFAMTVRMRVFGSGWEGDKHSTVRGSGGIVRVPFDEWSRAEGNVYWLVLSGFVEKEGYEQLRLYEIGYNKYMDFHFTLPYQELARLSDRKAPPSHVTVTIPLIPATDTPSAAAKGEKPQTLLLSYDRADGLEPRAGTLVVDSDVTGALVFVDDMLLGAAPCTLSLTDGFYDLHVKSEGGGEYRATVRVLADSEVAVRAVLSDQAQ